MHGHATACRPASSSLLVAAAAQQQQQQQPQQQPPPQQQPLRRPVCRPGLPMALQDWQRLCRCDPHCCMPRSSSSSQCAVYGPPELAATAPLPTALDAP
uniref:Uncharacterized protein n=1 Tax=Tetradesmus obliquus TaxID=3088 RepID=A0A383W238_TETOB|eukprot:jgi/Sobl393_1/7842/SZX71172.1